MDAQPTLRSFEVMHDELREAANLGLRDHIHAVTRRHAAATRLAANSRAIGATCPWHLAGSLMGRQHDCNRRGSRGANERAGRLARPFSTFCFSD
jgi:hypothetical protein